MDQTPQTRGWVVKGGGCGFVGSLNDSLAEIVAGWGDRPKLGEAMKTNVWDRR
jgi:hypothetical protein